MDKLRIATFNCRSAKSSLYEIKKLCSECDIIFLQETWLSSQEYHILESIDSNFYVKCTTAMDIESGILRGRPYGGCAIL
jgi:exonuclease III